MFYLLLLTHLLADFLLQSRTMGKKKSEDVRWLAAHLGIQTACFLPFGILFSLSNATVHGLIDWNIWKLYKLTVARRYFDGMGPAPEASSQFKYWEDHLFYTTIGIDQMLHIGTLYFLMQVYHG